MGESGCGGGTSVGVLGVAALVFTLIAHAGAGRRTDAQRRRRRRRRDRRPREPAHRRRSKGGRSTWPRTGATRSACLVWRQGGVVECFRTTEAPRRPGGAAAPPAGRRTTPTADAGRLLAASSYSCSSSLRLYEHNWYGGRRLSFWDRGYWQNLWLLRVRGPDVVVHRRRLSTVYLAEHADGGGWWYPGPTYPYAGEPVMHGTGRTPSRRSTSDRSPDAAVSPAAAVDRDAVKRPALGPAASRAWRVGRA